LQHFIKDAQGRRRAAWVIRTPPVNTDNASVSLRKLLLQTCNLHRARLPRRTFQGAA